MDSPKTYSKYSTLQRRDNELTLDTFSKLVRWKSLPRILDLGCGDGATTVEVLEPRLPRDYVKLVGSDLQEKMVKFARNSNKNSKLDFIQFDMAGEKILSGQYDHVFSFFAFHWVANLRKAFQNIYDMLTPGGDMLINFVADIPYYDVLKRQLEYPLWSSYFSSDMIPPIQSCRSPEKLLKPHLTESGFTNIQIFIEDRNFAYDNWAHCLKSLLAVDPIFSKLDIELKEEYLVDFFVTLRDKFSKCEEADGKIRMPYKLIVVYASKPE